MIFQEATRTRRLVGQIEEGEDIIEALSRLCRDNDVRAGHIRAVGTLSAVEVARFEPESGQYATAHEGEGHYELVSLSGNVSRLGDEVALRLEAMLSAMGPAGPQVLSGQLRQGTAVSCEFVLEIFEDLAIERRLDADTGRLGIRAIRRTQEKKQAAPRAPETVEGAEAEEPAAEEEPEPIAGKGMSWEDAAGEAEQVAEPDSTPQRKRRREKEDRSAKDIYGDVDFEEPLMESGDILEHPKLGRCRVMKVEEGEFAHVRLPRGRIRKLSLEIVDVEFDREEDGRRVFKARVGKS